MHWSTFSLVIRYFIFINISGFKRHLFTMIRKKLKARIKILTDWRSAKNKTVYGNNTLQTTKIGWKTVGRRILIILNERKILDCFLGLSAYNTRKWEVYKKHLKRATLYSFTSGFFLLKFMQIRIFLMEKMRVGFRNIHKMLVIYLKLKLHI